MTKINKFPINKWTDFKYNLDSKIITENTIRLSFNKFRALKNGLFSTSLTGIPLTLWLIDFIRFPQ